MQSWITTQQAAELLELKLQTVQAYLTRGIFPNARKVGNKYLIPPKDIDAFIAGQNEREERRKKPRTVNAALKNIIGQAKKELEKISNATPIEETRAHVKAAIEILTPQTK